MDPSKDTVVYKRYYHLFREGELESLVNSLSEKGWELEIVEGFYERDNWFVVIKVLASPIPLAG
jgi:hypothetical protein